MARKRRRIKEGDDTEEIGQDGVDAVTTAGTAAAVKKEQDSGLPEPIQLVSTPEEDLRKVVVFNDPGNSIIVTLLKRCHRRYKFDKPLTDDSYYVGIDANNFTPEFARSLSMSAFKNNTYDLVARIGASSAVASVVVPPVDMLLPCQLIFLKHLSKGEDSGEKFRDVSEDERAEYKTQQQDAFVKCHACPVLVASGEVHPDYGVIYDTREGRWRHFRMMMPKVEGKQVSKSLMDEINTFLGKYDQDIVSPNFALGVKKPMKPIPLGSPAQMILYGPHYSRIHEELKLSAYFHIFRAVDHFYGNDKKLNVFEINDKDIDTELVFNYIDEMGIRKEDWLEIVPPSWEGSQLVMPFNQGHRAPPSPELTALLMMPDIYTLGFAGYTNVPQHERGSTIRETVIHGLFVPKHIQSNPDLWRPVADEEIGLEAKEPYQDQLDHQIWSAPKMSVRSPWPEMATTDACLRPDMTRSCGTQTSPEPEAGPSTSHDKNIHDATKYYKAFIKKIRQGQNAGFIDKSVTLGPDGRLTWPGSGNEAGTLRKLPDEINVQRLIAEYDAADADRISERGRRILQRLFDADLADAKHVAKCARKLKSHQYRRRPPGRNPGARSLRKLSRSDAG
ncbi:hypothetical protein CSAL01_10125 [Colletotrichum salicis]|uniref:Uncharacterized protein n=1 Tax=Colletotrichum salicis TaxID=1209931 RepID=A0A135TZ92_9PEZI|nr:hypothetical protein CSAL01_10125 [Colletotrichum salicis]